MEFCFDGSEHEIREDLVLEQKKWLRKPGERMQFPNCRDVISQESSHGLSSYKGGGAKFRARWDDIINSRETASTYHTRFLIRFYQQTALHPATFARIMNQFSLEFNLLQNSRS